MTFNQVVLLLVLSSTIIVFWHLHQLQGSWTEDGDEQDGGRVKQEVAKEEEQDGESEQESDGSKNISWRRGGGGRGGSGEED